MCGPQARKALPPSLPRDHKRNDLGAWGGGCVCRQQRSVSARAAGGRKVPGWGGEGGWLGANGGLCACVLGRRALPPEPMGFTC